MPSVPHANSQLVRLCGLLGVCSDPKLPGDIPMYAYTSILSKYTIPHDGPLLVVCPWRQTASPLPNKKVSNRPDRIITWRKMLASLHVLLIDVFYPLLS